MDVDFITTGILWMIVFIFSTTVHEAAHAFVAAKGGDFTAYHGGQVSLNPLPHMQREPIGMVLVPILSYAFGGWMMGWASAPYDPYWAARHPRRSALMALAGPVSNLLIAIISFGLLYVFAPMATPGIELHAVLIEFGRMFLVLNLLLFIFNLIPVPPLDGAEAIILLLPDHLIQKWREFTAQIGIFGIFIAWIIVSKIFLPVYWFVALLLPEQALK